MLGKSRYLAIAFVFAAVFGAVLYLNPFTPEVAADKQVWISIDELELATVQREMGDAASNFDIDVSGVTAGIAIARVNSDGLAAISDQMHISFRKCGGYVLHPTQENAFAHVEKVLSAKDFERIGGYSIDNQANVDQLLPQAVETNIRQTISDLEAFHTRRHDQPTGLESAQHIKDAWDAIASQRADVSVNTFNHTSSPQPSVILTIQGAEFPAEYVVLGAHQDSIRTGSGNTTARAPGADDDASGIASLTEAIRILVESGFTPDRTVQFMAYAAEEVGLRGSNEIATQYSPANSNINVIGALQLDMTNFKGSPTVDVSLISDSAHTNSGQNQFVSDLISEYLPNLTVTTSNCGYGCSDHASWSANGFPASFPFEAPFGQHNGQIHRAGDTLTQSGGTADHAVKFTRIALAYVGELAKGTIPEAPSSGTRFDFDGDSKTDVSIFRPGPAEWWYLKSSDGGNFAAQFGTATDTLSPADYTGDGKTDIAFFRPGTSEWFVLRSEDNSFFSFPFGATGDIPAPGDFDGDGTADPAVFRPSSATWFILRSSDGGTTIQPFGANGDVPIVEDFDGDGTDDISIYRPSVSEWWLNRSTDGVVAFQFGSAGDQTVPADFTGDGKADVAFWRESTGEWFVLRSEDSSFFSFPFGQSGDVPVPGDYDGDGTADAAVFRPSVNTWFKSQSTNGFEAVDFGAAGDVAVPNAFVRQ